MRILMVHNFYRKPGGEDAVFLSEKTLLQSMGHDVFEYVDDNQVRTISEKITLPMTTVWSAASYQAIKELLGRTNADVAHFHNTFFKISPSAYYACRDSSVPVIQTLHNYRLLCPVATFYRDGHVCEACLGKSFALPAVKYACYHDSRLQTAVVASMLALHKALGTWQDKVDIFICLTEHNRRKFIDGGLPGEKIFVKPNFVEDAGHPSRKEEFVLFLGRLSAEKGVRTLIAAWSQLQGIPLRLAGDGPLANELQEQRLGRDLVFLGQVPNRQAQDLMRSARLLILPSEWYEGFPRVIVEAFAAGTPVIASRLGSMAELIRDGDNGLLFTPGDPADLAAKVSWLWAHPAEAEEMGRRARLEYEEKYTPQKNYQALMHIYQMALDGR
jgi:glycosyltransferase involved in cell wall biosynthesis